MAGLGAIDAISSVYETDPVGYLDQPRFLNAVLRLSTSIPPEALLDRLNEIEADLGRVRTFTNAPRTVDLDLLLYSNEIADTRRLTLPHPRMLERAFVLAPLAEIAPDLVHPVTHQTIAAHLSGLPDTGGIRPTADRLVAPPTPQPEIDDA
jgi:2-amino-4-hydroxy-6-hydroxymethyldihydropteridine diphosphokinase